MTKRIFRSILAVTLIAFLASTVIIPSVFYGFFRNEINEELNAEIGVIAVGVEKYGVEFLNSIDEAVNIVFCDADGNELYKTGKWHEDEGFLTETITVETTLDNGSTIAITKVYASEAAVLLYSIGPLLIALALMVITAVVLAKTLSNQIVKPINSIDPESPSLPEDYVEVSSLLHKIKRQNELISLQMNDLKQRQREFEIITENMGEGLVVTDNKGEILSYNRSAMDIFYQIDFSDRVNVYDLGMSEKFDEAVSEALKGHRREFEWKQGTNVYQMFTSPVFRDDSITGALIFIVDVTEKAERETMRREFTSNVSHELKTPLTSISGISEIMMNGIVKPEDVPGFAENIHTEAQRLIALVNDIIKLSQLDENDSQLEKEPVDLLLVAKEVKTRLRHVTSKSGVTFKLVGESTIVNGTSVILSEMIYNLCDNAITYNKTNGSVTLSVGERDGRPFVSVADTGIGIPQQAQTRVFERFYRVDKSHSRSIGGTGLGLSIVKHGAAYHGAELSLKSKLNEGTTVEILF
ncbi:MAG: histidine kinase [Clostridia bacterium]|nr:histidine kinase [Clostridia bacterium]